MSESASIDDPSGLRIETGHLYDYPKYYDLVYGSDWKAEFDFLEGCFDRFTPRVVERLFEPACGTGRLMYRFAKVGYTVSGNDLNPHAVAYCNQRLARHGFPETAVVGDMADFKVPKKFDVAFNMINSVRHLPDEATAEAHLKCVANALYKGGLYVLGLHLTPTEGERIEEESWSASRGHLTVTSSLWSEELDLSKREEWVGMQFEVYTPTDQFCIRDRLLYRTYTRDDLERLLETVPELECVAVFDFHYDLETPIEIDETTEDVVLILRKK